MSVDRSKRVKNMFDAPKTANAGDPATPTETPLKEDEIKNMPIDKVEEKTNEIPVLDNPLNEQKTETKVDEPTPPIPKKDIIKKEKDAEAAKTKEPKVYIGCRVSNEMKNALEDMAKDFAYLARKIYGLKIKDDSSSIQRAFLLLGMSCFTEKVRHKILQEYDNESLMQDEVSQQLLALMKIHNLEIDDIDI